MVMYGGATTSERKTAVEQRITASRLVELFDDDGDGALAFDDIATLETIMADADDIVTGLLIKKGWSADGLEHIALDRQVVRAWSGIVAQLAGERKPEWLDESGRGPFDAFGIRGREELGRLARGETRSVKEPEGGTHLAVGGDVGDYAFEFAPDPRIPGDRGRGSF